MGVAEPADGENNEEQAQRKSGRIRKPSARCGRSPQERKKKKGLARKRPKQRTQEAIVMWKGVRYGPHLEQEQKGTEDSEEQEDTEDSEQEGTVSWEKRWSLTKREANVIVGFCDFKFLKIFVFFRLTQP